MGEVDKLIGVLAFLAGLLIVVAYFTGFTSDVNSVGSVVNNLGNTFTGRNSQGAFAAYPTGG